MNITFNINFNTKWGENLYVTGSSPALGSNNLSKAFKLDYHERGIWKGSIAVNAVKERVLEYRYFVKNSDSDSLSEIYFEAGKPRVIAINSSTSSIECHDSWCGNSDNAPFLTAPFSDVLFAEQAVKYTYTHKVTNELIIRAIAVNIPQTHNVIICGNCAELGNWIPEKGIEMARIDGQRWEATLQVTEEKNIEYKFVVQSKSGIKRQRKPFVAHETLWEKGENRRLALRAVDKNASMIIEAGLANFDMPFPRMAGCSVPLFSLRSKESHGIGDIADLKLLIDWAAATGQKIIQLLPINDTSQRYDWGDSYPYNCISTIAIHPIYINLGALGEINDKALSKELHREGILLNHSYYLDYPEVWNSKMRYCRAIYEQEKDNAFAEPMYYSYLKENREWLYPYAIFCALRDMHNNCDFNTWGEFAVFDKNLTDKIFNAKGTEAHNNESYKKLRKSAEFYIYLQYNLHKQLTEVREYAHKSGIVLKGDIPIGISRNGVEAWQYHELFNFGQQAGAPPDYFSSTGQNWGFPTYNWERMAKDGYMWWKERLAHLAEYFDAYRIDHILGFFRIWEIPTGLSNGKYGHFNPAMPLTPEEIAAKGLGKAFSRYSIKISSENAIEAEQNRSGLFIEDPYQRGKYHPMISAREDKAYGKLSDSERKTFDALYHDYFFVRHNDFWYDNAVKKLQQLIAATNMLTCGEDLGMLAESVGRCLQNLHILSLELMIMPKTAGSELADPAGYPYLSVCTTSTHDTPTLRMWLGERLHTKGSTLKEGATVDNPDYQTDAAPEACIKIIKQNLNSNSMLAILPLQDWLSTDQGLRNRYVENERVNNPADPYNKWRYRMHITLEQLKDSTTFNKKICRLIKECGR